MLLAFFAAASAQPAAEVREPVVSEAPARATVRILRPAEIRRDHFEATDESVKRMTKVRETDGTLRPASLIEYY